MTIEEEKTFNGISILNFCWLHTFLYHHQPSRPICLFVFFQYPMELSILVVMQICIKMGPINSQLLVYHHSEIQKQRKYSHKKKLIVEIVAITTMKMITWVLLHCNLVEIKVSAFLSVSVSVYMSVSLYVFSSVFSSVFVSVFVVVFVSDLIYKQCRW